MALRGKIRHYFFIFGVFLLPFVASGQDIPESPVYKQPYTAMWQHNYANFRLTKHLFWHGELHFRTAAYENVPFTGRMSKIYNRHGLKYLFSKNFSATLGGVLRFNFSPEPGNENYKPVTTEQRIWHQYTFVLPLQRFMVYHRIRLEHRWSRSNLKGEDYIYRNRWRYKFQIKYPLNKPKLSPGAFYINPDIEVLMQSGQEVVNSPLEDLRIFPAVGYIASPRLKYATGLMYTLGQSLEDGTTYRRRWIFRFHVYFSLDWRNLKGK